MDGQWLTHRELASKLSITVAGARRRSQRARWARRIGNDGLARVLVPEDITLEPRPLRAPVVAGDDAGNVASVVAPDNAETIQALRDHVATLKTDVARLQAQLAGAETRASDEAAKTAQAIAAFESLAQRLEEIAAQRAIKPWWRRFLQKAG
jgi:hypothetical protein